MIESRVKRIQQLSSAVLFALALSPIRAAHADADRQYSSRFGSADTHVLIGVVDGKVTIVERRTSDGACATQVVSEESALSNSVGFYAGGGSNWIATLLLDNEAQTLCGFNVTPITRRGSFIIVDGGPGHDAIKSTSINDDEGGEGDDVIIGDEAFVNLSGGPGNDWVIQLTGYERASNLVGGPGDDSLCDLGDGSILIGGEGHDLGWNGIASSSREMEGTLTGEDCGDVAFAVLANWPF